MDKTPWCLSCGENPDSTDETAVEFKKNHTEESCPAGEPIIGYTQRFE